MYCGGLPQKTAPVAALQSTLQLAGAIMAVQLAWQSMFAWTSHDPLQLAWHFVLQSALGGVALHWSVQRLLQSSMQSAAQPESWPSQLDVQLALQSFVHAPVQSKLPGLAVQLVMQLALHVPVQEADALAVHWPSHSATKLPGVHSAAQVAGVVTNEQLPLTIRSQASALVSASATDDQSATGAATSAMNQVEGADCMR